MARQERLFDGKDAESMMYDSQTSVQRLWLKADTILVDVASTISSNGTAGGIGVYYGPNSTFNLSERVKDDTDLGFQARELTALIMAIYGLPTKDFKTLVLKTSCGNVARLMNKDVWAWRRHDGINKKNELVGHEELFLELHQLFRGIERPMKRVCMWVVSNKMNGFAKQLAEDAL